MSHQLSFINNSTLRLQAWPERNKTQPGQSVFFGSKFLSLHWTCRVKGKCQQTPAVAVPTSLHYGHYCEVWASDFSRCMVYSRKRSGSLTTRNFIKTFLLERPQCAFAGTAFPYILLKIMCGSDIRLNHWITNFEFSFVASTQSCFLLNGYMSIQLKLQWVVIMFCVVHLSNLFWACCLRLQGLWWDGPAPAGKFRRPQKSWP